MFRLGFFPFVFRLKFWVPTQTSFWIQRTCWNQSLLWTFEFSNSGFPFFFYFKDPGSDSGSSLLYFVWSSGFRLGLPFRSNARVGTNCCFEDSSFQTQVFNFILLLLRSSFRIGFFPFIFRLKLRVLTQTSFCIQRSCWNQSLLWIFKFLNSSFLFYSFIFSMRVPTRVFPFYILFKALGSDSDSHLDPTLVLEPIIPLKIRAFKLEFSILFFIFKIRVPTRVFPFYIMFKALGSDSDFLLDTTLVLQPIAAFKIRVFQLGFSILFFYF